MTNPSPPQPPGALGTIRGQLVQSSADTLTAPENIVQTVIAARTIYESMRFQNMKRFELFAGIEGLLQGNPPYDPIELEQNGMSIANFNNMDAPARYNKGGLAFWNLLNASEYIAKFCFYDDKANIEGYGDILAKYWDKVVREWKSFGRHFCCLTGQLLRFGYASLIWSDERDWKWTPVETAKLYLQDEASTDTELLTTILVETPFTVQELYQIYDKCKELPKDKSPWNCDILATYLVYRANNWAKTVGTENAIINMMDLQVRLQNNDVCLSWLYSDEVRLITLFQKEYSGKISHYIFDRYYTNPTGNDGFLYFVNEQYGSLSEAFSLFTYSPDVFTVHSNRGLGHMLFAPCQATSQLDCDMFNMARFSSSPIIRSSPMSTRDIGAITFRPGMPLDIGGAEFEQNNLGANIAGVVSASSYLLQKLSTNIIYAGDDAAVPDQIQGSITDSQAKRKDYKEQGVQRNVIAHFYNQFDSVLEQMLIKMMKSKKGDPGYDAYKRWKDLCIQAGVPEELFSMDDGYPRYFYCRASRVGGDGSTLGLITGLDTIGPLVPGFSSRGMRNYQKDYVRASMGSDYVERYLGEVEPDESSEGSSLAQQENNGFTVISPDQSPKAARFSPDNDQRAHIRVHMEFLQQLMQARMGQELDAQTADKMFSVSIPHTQEHLSFIARNPLQRVFFESVKKPWEQIYNYAQLNRKNAESEIKAEINKQQKEQEKMNAAQLEQQRKDWVVEQEQARKDRESNEKMERNKEQSETRGEIQREATTAQAANNRRKVELEAANKRDAKNQDEAPSVPVLRQQLLDMQGTSPSPSDFE